MGAGQFNPSAGLCGEMGVKEESSGVLPSRLNLIFSAIVMAGYGLFMLLQVAGVLPVDWLNPNPKTPAFVFSLVGCFLLLGAGLVLGQLLSFKTTHINVLGWSAFGMGWVLAHWLVFFADDARCSLSIAVLNFGGVALCQSLAGLVLLGFDVLFVGMLVQWLVRRA